MLHAQAGQWRRNPAGRTRDGSRGPPFPSGASLPVRGAGCVPPFRAGSVTGACPSLSSLCTFPVFSPACPSAALAVNSLCNQRLGLLTQRFSTGLLPKNVDIHASGARDRLLPMSRHFPKKTLIINDLSGLSKAFPQACTQKVWISPRSASLGAALRRMARFAKKLPGFASGGVFPL